MTDQRSPQPSVEANRAQRRSKKKTSPALFVVPVLLVIAGVTLFLVLRGGDSPGLPFIGGGDDGDEVPPFEFVIKKAKIVATKEEADLAALTATATSVGQEITPIMDDMFTAGYLDPSNWREGDYDEVFTAFSDAARPTAEENVETLTLGMTAGDRFEKVEPTKGGLEYRVLFTPEGEPDTVVVKFRFYAIGEGTDGTYTSIVSHGQMFLRNVGGWKITAFSVKRNDQVVDAPVPAPSGSASTTPSA